MPPKTEPQTEAGRALLADLTMGYEPQSDDVVMAAIREAMGKDIVAIEQQAAWPDTPEAVERLTAAFHRWNDDAPCVCQNRATMLLAALREQPQ